MPSVSVAFTLPAQRQSTGGIQAAMDNAAINPGDTICNCFPQS